MKSIIKPRSFRESIVPDRMEPHVKAEQAKRIDEFRLATWRYRKLFTPELIQKYHGRYVALWVDGDPIYGPSLDFAISVLRAKYPQASGFYFGVVNNATVPCEICACDQDYPRCHCLLCFDPGTKQHLPGYAPSEDRRREIAIQAMASLSKKNKRQRKRSSPPTSALVLPYKLRRRVGGL
jgi:hypothetical protein